MKKIAVLSDIHGNNAALEAVVDDLKRKHVDMVIKVIIYPDLYGPRKPLNI